MSDSEEKTEEPTAHKLKEARKKGEVAQSKDLTAAVSLLAVTGFLCIGGAFAYRHLSRVLDVALDAIASGRSALAPDVVAQMLTSALWLAIPAGLVAMVAGMLAAFAQTRGIFSTDPLKIKFERLNPVEAITRLFSTRQLGVLLQMLAKAAALCALIALTVKVFVDPLVLAMHGHALHAGQTGAGALRVLFGAGAAILVVFGGIDLLQQHLEHIKKNRMSKSERKRERREQEGDPLLRSHLKAQRRALVDAPMNLGLSRASVVVTNPTHFAVALYYEDGVVELPRVVAKAEDAEALQMRERATELGIPVLESPPLARALHAAVPLGEAIHDEHVEAVAEVFRWLARLRQPSRRHAAPE